MNFTIFIKKNTTRTCIVQWKFNFKLAYLIHFLLRCHCSILFCWILIHMSMWHSKHGRNSALPGRVKQHKCCFIQGKVKQHQICRIEGIKSWFVLQGTIEWHRFCHVRKSRISRILPWIESIKSEIYPCLEK